MSNREFKKPDVTAPRFRPKAHYVLNKEFFAEFRERYPKYKDLTNKELSAIVNSFNNLFWETVIDKRDGVQLPEELGYIFVGTCPASKKKNIDFGKSSKYGYIITNNNWDTDGKLGKIFYTNYANKYKFINRECWSFNACRTFSRSLAKVYPEQWMMYVAVDPYRKIRKIYQGAKFKDMRERANQKGLEDYNELEI
jgi:hypothetical protein